ncbi:winged helix-turn-helix domain-containing protein [Dactylosporangium matsuzakiense]|uniref:Transcriptional regulator n=2 Tax=Dactylosporangium matsuzakiense TaxID=53360 RepID=A0A9W6KKA6_9ACTN|nr:transcriptional regulator [Dactylosporangium matsuzakiense]
MDRMSTDAADLAALAALLADETRAAMCLALLDGRAWTAGELAAHAGVARSTATGHLDRLVGGGLLIEERQGRHRYVRLADASVAHLLEDLSVRLQPRPDQPRGLRQATATAAMKRARTCYDHLAGELGVAVADAMTARGLLDQRGGFALTAAGLAWLTEDAGIDAHRLQGRRRPLARGCLDWTERRPHLAGVAGAQLCERFLAQGWIRRIGTTRAVKVTDTGRRGLSALLGID